MHGWITVHDADSISRKRPEGRQMLVRADAIGSIRPYEDGRVRAVLNIYGTFLHVTEDLEYLQREMDRALP